MVLVALSGAATLAACAHVPRPAPGPPAAARAAPVSVTTDEQYAIVKGRYDTTPVGDPSRGTARQGLENFQLGEAKRELASGHVEAAWESFARAISLWDADELKHAEPDEALAALAAELEARFRTRGAHREVLTAIAVQIGLRPDDAKLRPRFEEVVRWLGGEKVGCEHGGCDRVIEDLETAVASWPSPFVVDRLAALYNERLQARPPGGMGLGDLSTTVGSRERLTRLRAGTDLALLYLRVSRPDDALGALKALADRPEDNPRLRQALERYVAPAAKPFDAAIIGANLGRDPATRAVGARVCRDAERRFPASYEIEVCVGELAQQQEQVLVAIRAFEKAVAIAPERREAWDRLALLHQIYLLQLVGEERTSELEAQLAKVEEFHAEARRRFPNAPLKVSLAGAYVEVGRGFFNVGRIDDAKGYLERSLAIETTTAALEQLGVIQSKREHAPEAVAVYQKALAHLDRRPTAADDDEKTYWTARLERDLADAYDQMGDAKAPSEARRKSLAAWDVLLAHARSEQVGEVEVERGKILFGLDDKERAFAAFEHAIDSDPDKGSTYADVLAFLIPRGEREECLDTFHRALGHAGVSEYLKVYFSLWMTDLDRRTGHSEDLLAHHFLESTDGPRWHHALARWAAGRATDADLALRADTTGKRAEADFYRAMRKLADGKSDEARTLWRKVVDTGMMAFFEFDMASFFLRHPGAVVASSPHK